jgi:cobalt-zinc-cadmium efflux system outer membrane protein
MFSLAAFPVALLFLGSADPGQPASLRLAALPPDPDLGRLLWERAPDLAAARARVATARAQIVRAETLPNPTLDLSWNTIPVGETNPPGLSSRLGSVPNYAVGLTQPFEIRKRGPRQRAARYGAEATLWDAADQLRETWLDLLAVVGRIASSEQRMAALSGLVEDAAKLTELQHRRAEKGDAAALEFERARLEEERLRSSLAEERQKLAVALTDCARLTGAACEPFGSAERAQAFFDNAVSRSADSLEHLQAKLDERPDLKSLAATEEAAQSAGELARARVWPDPALRVGFSYDTFLVSGNQAKSVSVALAFPLPVFERGHADRAEASASRWAARRSRERATAQANLELPILLRQMDELRARRVRTRGSTLPMAQGIVDRIAKAVTAGGAALQDLLQARRTLGELLADAADLEFASFETSLALLRAAGTSPVAIDDLRQHVMP